MPVFVVRAAIFRRPYLEVIRGGATVFSPNAGG